MVNRRKQVEGGNRMKAILAAGLAFIATLAIGDVRPAVAEEPCNPVGRLALVCGPLNSEDLVQVPGTTWIVASGMDGGAAGTRGSLHLIDSVDKSWQGGCSVWNPAGRRGRG